MFAYDLVFCVSIGIGFRRMHPSIDVVRRRIDCIDLHILGARIPEVMLGSWRNHDDVPRDYGKGRAVEFSGTGAGKEEKRLFRILVRLSADFPARRDSHDDQLAISAREQDFAEIIVIGRFFYDIRVIAHRYALWL
jgi:hypothetical protein